VNGRCAAGSSDFFIFPGTPHADAAVVSNLFSGVAPLSYALDFHLERHNLLAANLANVDTPRYKPLDLARVGNDGNGATGANSGFEQAMQVALARTNEAHLQVPGADPLVGRVFQDLSAGGGADGNYVSLDRESGKLAANRLRYDMVSVLVKSQLDALMRAANDGKG
jgi:flagellar basal-body rod protein FlgB